MDMCARMAVGYEHKARKIMDIKVQVVVVGELVTTNYFRGEREWMGAELFTSPDGGATTGERLPVGSVVDVVHHHHGWLTCSDGKFIIADHTTWRKVAAREVSAARARQRKVLAEYPAAQVPLGGGTGSSLYGATKVQRLELLHHRIAYLMAGFPWLDSPTHPEMAKEIEDLRRTLTVTEAL